MMSICRNCLSEKQELFEFYDNSFASHTLCKKCSYLIDFQLYPLPKLVDIQDNLEKVLDYAFVKRFPEEVIPYFEKFEKDKILDILEEKLEQNPNLTSLAYLIAVDILGDFAGEWIENQWLNSKKENITIFAKPFSKCLPFEKGFKIVIDFLNSLDEKALKEQINCLSYFKTDKTLDFLEQIQDKIINTPALNLGCLVASSKLTWLRAEKWLQMGRPLSLIALVAISKSFKIPTSKSTDEFLSKLSPSFQQHLKFKSDLFPSTRSNCGKLLEPKEIEYMNQVLDEYLAKDNVPRTRNTINYIKANWDLILQEK